MRKVCIMCNKEYNAKKDTSKFCSMDCKRTYNQFLVKCAACGKEKIVYRNAYLSKENHFCDNKCQWEWRIKTGEMVGENHPNKKKYIEVKCENCDKVFPIRPDRHKKNKSGKFYCCQKCQDEYKTKQIGELHFNYSQVDVQCLNCGGIFKKKKSHSEYSDSHFCDKKCYVEYKKAVENRACVVVSCEVCGVTKIVNKARFDNSKYKRFYCDEHRNYHAKGELNYNWQGIVKFNCSYCGENFLIRQAILNAGAGTEWTNHYCSMGCKNKHHGELFRGENHPNWTGGPNKLLEMIRTRVDFNDVRKNCFIRDNYKSVLSNKASNKSGGLNHHHLDALSHLINKNNITMDNYEEFNDILFDIDNVVTLLGYEHMEFHSLYGYKTTKEQFKEFKELYLGGNNGNE